MYYIKKNTFFLDSIFLSFPSIVYTIQGYRMEPLPAGTGWEVVSQNCVLTSFKENLSEKEQKEEFQCRVPQKLWFGLNGVSQDWPLL